MNNENVSINDNNVKGSLETLGFTDKLAEGVIIDFKEMSRIDNLSEINKNGEDVNHPKLYHDYTLFDEKYDIIHSEDLQIPRLVAGEWRKKVSLIRLYKLKG